MSDFNSNQSTNGLIQRFIGSDMDAVRKVAGGIDDIKAVMEHIPVITEVADNLDMISNAIDIVTDAVAKTAADVIQTGLDVLETQRQVAIAREFANDRLKSGGVFTPVAGDEYPDVCNVKYDTTWLVMLSPNIRKFTFTEGPLAGMETTNLDIIFYDEELRTFTLITNTDTVPQYVVATAEFTNVAGEDTFLIPEAYVGTLNTVRVEYNGANLSSQSFQLLEDRTAIVLTDPVAEPEDIITLTIWNLASTTDLEAVEDYIKFAYDSAVASEASAVRSAGYAVLAGEEADRAELAAEKAAVLISNAGGVDKGDYEDSITLESYYDFAVWQRSANPTMWKARSTTPLPYTINAATIASPVGDTKLQPFNNDISQLEVIAHANRVQTRDVTYLQQGQCVAASYFFDKALHNTYYSATPLTGDISLIRLEGDEYASILLDNVPHTLVNARIAAKKPLGKLVGKNYVGNISAYVGDSLQEQHKDNVYEYPDNSGYWYGVALGSTFPIVIPADPSNDAGWVSVSALTGDWGGISQGTEVKHRRGTNAEILAGTPAIGELWFNTTDSSIHMGDGATQGGIPIPKKRNTQLSFDNLASVLANTSLKVGYSIQLKERTTGKGGGGTWDVYASGTFPLSTGVVAHDTLPLQLVLRTNGVYIASQHGATHDSTDSATILNYIMTKSNYVIDGSYSVASPLLVQNNTKGEMKGATINALTDDFKVFEATGKNAFEMTGNLKVKGPGMGVGTGVGIWFFDCYGYKMDCNPDVSALGEGIIIDGTAIAPGGLGDYRGRQGRWTNPTAHNCKKGIQTLRRAEYSLWSNPQVSQCTQVGWTNTAGNTNVIGGNIQDNQNGVLLQETGTTNANHGMFTSVNINHNIGYNLRCEDVHFGHSFSGCHFYGDSASAGTIELIRSSGINITDGTIDAKIVIDGDVTPTPTVTGWNRISGNQMDETYTVFESTNGGREKTIVSDNFQRNGDAWGLNDRAFIEAKASAETSTQTLTSNVTTVVLFPTENSDNRSYFDHTTGVFTSQQAVNMMIEFNFQVAISGGTFVDGFVAVYVNGSPQALSGLVAFNAANTSLGANGHLTLALQAGNTVDIRANIEATAGTITVGADPATNVSFVSSN